MINKDELFIDLEKIPCLGWFWGCGKQVVTYKQVLEPGRIICISYKFAGEEKVRHLAWDDNQNDKAMLEKFREIANESQIIYAHNGRKFDIPELNTRLAYHELPPLAVKLVGDTLTASRSTFRLPSNSLEYMGEYFGIPNQKMQLPIETWLKVWRENDRKELKRMLKRCDSDVLMLEQIKNRIAPYAKMPYNKAFALDNRGVCSNCAGPLIKVKDRMTSTLGLRQQYQCKACGKYDTVGKHLIKQTSEFPRAA